MSNAVRYDAITIDTETIVRNGFHFDSGLLAQLTQFKNGLAEFVISEVVVSEIEKRLAAATQATKDSVESSHRRAVGFGLPVHDAASAFSIPAPDAKAIAHDRLGAFLNAVGAEVIKAETAKMADLVDLYFSAAPPFASVGNKKSEFPDAIALLSLEAWARAKNKRILAVSGDNDWIAFGSKSQELDVVSDLGAALALLQQRTDEAAGLVRRALIAIHSGSDARLAKQFQELLTAEVEQYRIEGVADSSYRVDVDEVALSLSSFQFLGEDNDFAFNVVRMDKSETVAEVSAELSVAANGSFSLYIWDSVDKEEIPAGSLSAELEEQMEVELLVTFEGNLQAAEVEIAKIEIVTAPSYIDFGYIEPSRDDDYYDDR